MYVLVSYKHFSTDPFERFLSPREREKLRLAADLTALHAKIHELQQSLPAPYVKSFFPPLLPITSFRHFVTACYCSSLPFPLHHLLPLSLFYFYCFFPHIYVGAIHFILLWTLPVLRCLTTIVLVSRQRTYITSPWIQKVPEFDEPPSLKFLRSCKLRQGKINEGNNMMTLQTIPDKTSCVL